MLFFGDVEPDCVSKSPRNRQVWSHAAERFAEGKLGAIFLECSFPKNHPTEFLYGHLSVEHLFDELRVLAQMVKRYREKMRRSSSASNRSVGAAGAGVNGGGSATAKLNGDSRFVHPHLAPSPLGTAAVSVQGDQHPSVYDGDSELRGQLQGLGVIIIHVKPALFPTFVQHDPETEAGRASPTSSSADGSQSSSLAAADHSHTAASASDHKAVEPILDQRSAPQKILDELNLEEHLARLGVRFVMAEKGMRIEC